MTPGPAVVTLACALFLGGCTSATPGSDGADVWPDASHTTSPDQARSTFSSSPPPPSPTPTSTVDVPEEFVLGTGTVTVDGVQVRISGDCDISRAFGAEPVRVLDDEVDTLLVVDNLTGDGGHDGPFAIQVRLLGQGELVGRTLVSEGGPGEQGATLRTTYEGEIEVAELRERRELAFLDVATLHLEARQQRTHGEEGPRRRDLAVDVVCPISRPAG